MSRTDKIPLEGKEKYHELDEYMDKAEDYFTNLENSYSDVPLRKRAFISSDDSSVLKEAEIR